MAIQDPTRATWSPDVSPAEEWATRPRALALIRQLACELTRPRPAVDRLLAAIWTWRDAIAIDDRVGELIEAIDPMVEPRAASVLARLHRVRSVTALRAAAERETRTTQPLRPMR